VKKIIQKKLNNIGIRPLLAYGVETEASTQQNTNAVVTCGVDIPQWIVGTSLHSGSRKELV
jgi:hypothetical protein